MKRFQRGPKPKVVDKDVFAWYKEGDSYCLNPMNGTLAKLSPESGNWRMSVVIDKQKYGGIRPTLEEAVKTLNKLLHDKDNDIWLRSKWSIVLEPWQGNLKDL